MQFLKNHGVNSDSVRFSHAFIRDETSWEIRNEEKKEVKFSPHDSNKLFLSRHRILLEQIQIGNLIGSRSQTSITRWNAYLFSKLSAGSERFGSYSIPYLRQRRRRDNFYLSHSRRKVGESLSPFAMVFHRKQFLLGSFFVNETMKKRPRLKLFAKVFAIDGNSKAYSTKFHNPSNESSMTSVGVKKKGYT